MKPDQQHKTVAEIQARTVKRLGSGSLDDCLCAPQASIPHIRIWAPARQPDELRG